MGFFKKMVFCIMRILHIASELTSVAKVGGLGDVLMGLSRELLVLGHTTVVVLPNYGCSIKDSLVETSQLDRFRTYFSGEKQGIVRYYRLNDQIIVALLDTEDGFFSTRKTIYGAEDDISFFLAFTRAVAEWVSQSGTPWDVFHVHDWPTAIFSRIYQVLSPQKVKIPTILTVHNFAYQGWCSAENFLQVGLYPHDFEEVFSPYGNLLRGGLQYVDLITTVSPTYAQEMRESKEDPLLHDLLQKRDSSFYGVLNGLDELFWNPETDLYLPCKYSSDDIEMAVTAKKQNKKVLFEAESLFYEEEVPLIVCITRLVAQKGVNSILAIAEAVFHMNASMVIVGSVPDEKLVGQLGEIHRHLVQKQKGGVLLGLDEKRAHLAYAAADYIVIPSLYEPCGLTQLIGMRYGVIPIARKTGGLADTIIDVEENPIDGNGFLFEGFDSADALHAVTRALRYGADRHKKQDLMKKIMKIENTWKKSAKKYLQLYTAVLTK